MLVKSAPGHYMIGSFNGCQQEPTNHMAMFILMSGTQILHVQIPLTGYVVSYTHYMYIRSHIPQYCCGYC